MGAAWVLCSLGRANVFSFGADVSSFRANVSSFWPNVFSFEGDVSTLAGDVSSFWRGALVGDGARTEGEIPRLRCAALGMTEAAGANRGRGWRMLAMTSTASNTIIACVAGSAGKAGAERGSRATLRGARRITGAGVTWVVAARRALGGKPAPV